MLLDTGVPGITPTEIMHAEISLERNITSVGISRDASGRLI